ncbi:MAG: CDP-alcohol phosphatidyltransferase family protein [Paludibacteraceae bacterium]|jgi:CDP-diacylglycerol--serine O-phosphatidyltransferase|nr:CDP-alcohol phosphatidyltransferase family protein [Paludibacteraceae bacterium]
MQLKRIIPNSLTCANLLCGSVAVFMATQEQFLWSFAFILAGGLFDFFDGASARWLKVPSPLGVQLDSLADDITFGLAPAIALFCYLQPIIGWWALIALLIAAFSAIRLAKFNIDERQTTSFIGLATPPNAIFWTSLICYLHSIAVPVWIAWVLLAGSLLSCYLLISEIPFFSFKSAGEGKMRMIVFLFGCCGIMGTCTTIAITNHQIAIAAFAGAICVFWYILINLLTLTQAKK